jgi:enoyl-CoA hydratase/carnithine racemase
MSTNPAVAPGADDEVLYSVAHGIATVTLNRPQRLNTISREMLS